MLICDTNAYATGLWHERYLGFRSEAVDAISRRDVADLYLLMNIDVPFVQDGWRDGQSIRNWMHGLFVKRLTEDQKNFHLLCGDWTAREGAAVAAIGVLLKDFRRLSA